MPPEGATMADSERSRRFWVRIPGAPASCLLPNAQRRLNHHQWGPFAADLRQAAKHAADEALWSPRSIPVRPIFTGPVRLACVIAWPARRKVCDFQAAVHALKPAVDGLEDAGIVANDRQVVGMDVAQRRADPGDRAGWVEITVKEA